MIFMKFYHVVHVQLVQRYEYHVDFYHHVMITAAFSSKRIYEPSLRRAPLFVRTTTALTTSPFLTTPPGVACLTEQTIISPILAVLRPEPPKNFNC